jgi:hypothetical protein
MGFLIWFTTDPTGHPSQMVGALRVIHNHRIGAEQPSGGLDRGGSRLLQGPLLLSAKQPVAQSLSTSPSDEPNPTQGRRSPGSGCARPTKPWIRAQGPGAELVPWGV